MRLQGLEVHPHVLAAGEQEVGAVLVVAQEGVLGTRLGIGKPQRVGLLHCVDGRVLHGLVGDTALVE